MRLFVVSAIVILSIAAAGAVSAGIPSAATSTVEREGQGSPGDCDPDSVTVCPASDMGQVEVTVTVRNVYGDPLSDKTVDCWAVEVVGDFCWCAAESLQTGITDINGEVVFYFTDFGGCGDIQFDAECEGIGFDPSPTIYVKSPDSDGTCLVDLLDFIYFAGAYLTGDPCSDYDCTGLVDLLDFIAFATHYLHACP